MIMYTASDVRAIEWSHTGADATITGHQMQAFTSGLATATASNQPTSIRPGRIGIRIRNTSTPTSTQGWIRVLNTSQTVNAAYVTDVATGNVDIKASTSNQVTSIMESDPNVRTITAYDLLEERQFNCYPTSESYHLYDDYRQSVMLSPNDWQRNVAGCLESSEGKAAMSTIIIMMPPSTTTSMTLSWTLMSDDVVRFPANSTMSYLHKTPMQWSSGVFAANVAQTRSGDGRKTS